MKNHVENVMGFDFPAENNPYYNFRESQGSRCDFSYSGLGFDYMHRAGSVLFNGNERHSKGDVRIRRVVATQEGILSYRLCQAMEGSGYEAFVVGCFEAAQLGTPEYEDSLSHYLRQAESLCEEY